jgi:pimeloyl-ACP methyl ester carboxylesterase
VIRNRAAGGWRGIALIATTALATVGGVLAQDPAAKEDPAKAAKTAPKGKTRKGGLLAPGGGKAKAVAKGADPFAGKAEAGKAAPAPGTFHYAFKLGASDGTPLNALYYPSRLGTGSPAVILVHERDRSTKDFQDKIAELDNQGLAESLQKLGYAVLAVDLRGHGVNARRSLGAKDWQAMIGDLQSSYLFLIDRHNRGELNLARLGVVAVGEGANLAAAWASVPEAATSSPGRAGDLGGLVLISPMVDAQSQGLRIGQPLRALAPRMPLCVLAGERDPASAEVVKSARPAIVRVRGNKVELFPSSLHGFKLLRLEPNVTKSITDFLDETLRAKAEEWEPRYNLAPVPYSDVQTVLRAAPKAEAPRGPADEAK